MNPSSNAPNRQPLEFVSETTIGTLLEVVDERVQPLNGDPNVRVADLYAASPNGDEFRLNIRREPFERSRDGATLFVKVWPIRGSTQEAHWHFYPEEDGGTLTKSPPVIPSEEQIQDELGEGEFSPDKWVLAVQAQARKIRQEEREAGFTLAQEQDTQELIQLIQSGRPFEEDGNIMHRAAQSLLRFLGIKRP
jgi:hypothetical protein